MQSKRLLLLFSLPLFLAGCGEDGINDGADYFPGQNGDIVFDIGFAPQTRVSTGADFKSVWENGDEIGVYVVAHDGTLASSGNYIHNVKLTYDGSLWSQETPMYWPTVASGISSLNFYAYHPYDAGATDPNEIVFNVKADQSAAADYNASDLLTAKSDNSGNGWSKGSTVALTFSHALSMVQLTIDDAVGALDVNEDITVTLRSVLTGCALNLGTPEVSASGAASNITMYRVEQPGDANYSTSFTFRGLVPNQTIAQGDRIFLISNGNQFIVSPAMTLPLTLSAEEAELFTVTTGN